MKNENMQETKRNKTKLVDHEPWKDREREREERQ